MLTLNQFLGYDLNTVEFAIRDGVPVAIDFCNPAPDAEAASVGQANFEWVVEAVSEMAIRKAREHVPGRDNLSWGKFVQAAVTKRGAVANLRKPTRSIERKRSDLAGLDKSRRHICRSTACASLAHARDDSHRF